MSKRELEPDIEYQKAFGNRIRKLREDIGWTQIDLSIHSKISEYQISIIENGHEGANLQTIKAISVALGKRPSELLDFKYNLKLNTNFPKKKEKKPGTTSLINKLMGDNFFNNPRSVRDVLSQCKGKFDIKLRSAETSGALLILVKKNILKITRSSDGRNLYQKRKVKK